MDYYGASLQVQQLADELLADLARHQRHAETGGVLDMVQYARIYSAYLCASQIHAVLDAVAQDQRYTTPEVPYGRAR